MASSPEVIAAVMAKLHCQSSIETKKMFGEYAIYANRKVVGMVCDDQLFIKITATGQDFVGAEQTTGPPYPGAKLAFAIDHESVQSGWLSQLVDLTQSALPLPKKKK